MNISEESSLRVDVARRHRARRMDRSNYRMSNAGLPDCDGKHNRETVRKHSETQTGERRMGFDTVKVTECNIVIKDQ